MPLLPPPPHTQSERRAGGEENPQKPERKKETEPKTISKWRPHFHIFTLWALRDKRKIWPNGNKLVAVVQSIPNQFHWDASDFAHKNKFINEKWVERQCTSICVYRKCGKPVPNNIHWILNGPKEGPPSVAPVEWLKWLFGKNNVSFCYFDFDWNAFFVCFGFLSSRAFSSNGKSSVSAYIFFLSSWSPLPLN